ncbi:type II toxin-antitoxin system ParD family antitoxin [Paracidovorax citrulli]
MNISLPESLKQFAEEQADQSYGSTSEYVRELIRRDQLEQARHKLRMLIGDGLSSGPARDVDAAYLAEKRKRYLPAD